MFAAEAHRSTTWVWAVVGGFVVALVLLWHVVSNAIGTLPDEIRDRLRASIRKNVRPLAVSGVVLVWTLAYGLYSVAVTPLGSTAANQVAAGRTSGSQDSGSAGGEAAGTSDTAGPAASGVSGAGGTGAGGTAAAGQAKAKAAAAASAVPGVSLGAPTG